MPSNAPAVLIVRSLSLRTSDFQASGSPHGARVHHAVGSEEFQMLAHRVDRDLNSKILCHRGPGGDVDV